jgi:dihydroneopterin aldolase
MDVIFIRDLRLETVIGAYEFERCKPQMLHFELEIGRNRFRASETDALEDTVDYAAVVHAIEEVLATHTYHLLEPLAEQLASMILQRFDAQWIKLEVTKAGVVPAARSVGVRIERRRG